MTYSVPLFAPLIYCLSAAMAAAGPDQRPGRILSIGQWLAFAAFAVAVASLACLVINGPGTSVTLDANAFPLSIRVDLPSIVMLLLVTFIGWIVLRYSATYLDGEARQGHFTTWMNLTLAAVCLFVTAGSLPLFVASFIGTSLCLHQLLVFYPERQAARRAARKKFILSRIADSALCLAALILSVQYQTADIATILTDARAGVHPDGIGMATALIALAALLKSAQFPTHGWLTEVMETPTPVSALLHAGLVNAGGFLLIRFSDVMLLSPVTLAALVVVGAFTALFGGLVMLTQSAVKTSLAWSTVAQMGFMLLQCGLGAFSAALLHIVAHSLYKAHAFLSSGGAVEAVLSVRRPGPVAVPNGRAVWHAFLLALVIYVIAGLAFGFWHKPPQALALGAILIFGVAYLLAQGLAGTAPRALTWRTSLYGLSASFSYFALQWLTYKLTMGSLPLPVEPSDLQWALMGLAIITFGLVAIAQSLFPLWAYHPAAAGLRVHLQNGLYINALFDRLLGHFALAPVASRKD